jgi:protein-disulfide isomerase
MSEETNIDGGENRTPVQQVVVSGTSSKDFLIPLSIVIAGLFVGAGLYFGGGSTSQEIAQQVVPVPGGVAAAEAVGTTDKVSPVDENDHIKGSLSAQIKVIEYSDFDCPFCSRFHDVMNSVVASDDDVAWIYRQFPLEQLHPNAPAVAIASECVTKFAGNEGFWAFSDAYFKARGEGDKTAHAELIPNLVAQVGVDSGQFTECFEGGEFDSEVEDDLNNAVETGGRGTPWSIIVGPTGKTYPVNGALPQAAVEQLIEVARQEA